MLQHTSQEPMTAKMPYCTSPVIFPLKLTEHVTVRGLIDVGSKPISSLSNRHNISQTFNLPSYSRGTQRQLTCHLQTLS